MNLFHVIDEAQVILRSKGLFRQAKVYRRGTAVYAGFGGGFIRLHSACATSKPDVSWIDLDAEGVEVKGGLAPKFAAPVEGVAA